MMSITGVPLQPVLQPVTNSLRMDDPNVDLALNNMARMIDEMNKRMADLTKTVDEIRCGFFEPMQRVKYRKYSMMNELMELTDEVEGLREDMIRVRVELSGLNHNVLATPGIREGMSAGEIAQEQDRAIQQERGARQRELGQRPW